MQRVINLLVHQGVLCENLPFIRQKMGIGDEAAPTLGNVKLQILLQYPQRFQFAIDGISAQPKQTRGLANVALRCLVGFE